MSEAALDGLYVIRASQARRDPVAPAKPTPEAQANRNRRMTADTLASHGWSTLMRQVE